MQSTPKELEDLEIDQEDDFDKIYKGEISKSGTAILPSKRVRRIPELEQKVVESSADTGQENELKEKDDSKNISEEVIAAAKGVEA